MLTTTLLLAEADSSGIWQAFAQYALIGLTNGALFALVALGYTMVYGIIELINFAHGDVFMLGAFLALAMIGAMADYAKWNWGDPTMLCLGIGLLLVVVPIFCATLNVAIDRVVYKPLRRAPKLAPLVSAIGVSFVLMNVGLLWGGAADRHFDDLVPRQNLLAEGAGMSFTIKEIGRAHV